MKSDKQSRIERRIARFDQQHAHTLHQIWMVGDIHGNFQPLAEALLHHRSAPPSLIVFAGDIDIEHRPFRECLEPMRNHFPSIRVAFIHGNHDADSYEAWACLHNAGDAVALHGRVLDVGGLSLAGLGGTFLGRVWRPPETPKRRNRAEALGGDPYRFRDGQRPKSSFLGAIYPDEVDTLGKMPAQILVTHEAPSCHPFGFEALDELARSMGVLRVFHGHHHDDRTSEYQSQREEMGFETIALAGCAIKNGLGDLIWPGD